MNKLTGKVAIVTDAFKGMGTAFAKGFAAVAVTNSADKEGGVERAVLEITEYPIRYAA